MRGVLPEREGRVGLCRIAAVIALAAAAFVPSVPALAQQPLTGLFYFAAQNVETGQVEQRGIAGSNGVAFDNLLLAPDTGYRLWILQAATLHIDDPSVITTGAGEETIAPEFLLHDDGSADSDGDGLHDDGEFIMGTDPDDRDTDDDGVEDAAEVRQGTNPADGFPARTGVIGSADTPGTAKDVCTFNDMAVVADGDRGVSVFNVFNGMDPVIIAQVDTPGSADRVACAGDLIAVADGSAGLAIIDVSDPPAARIVKQVALGAPATSIAAGATYAFVGIDNGKVVAVDLLDGVVLAEQPAGGSVQDLRLEGDVLHVLVQHEVRTYEIFPDFLAFRDRVTTSAIGPEQFVGTQRLFVGGGLAYPGNRNGYDTIDVSDPAALRFRGAASDSGPRGFKQIVANGSGLGVAAVAVNFGDGGEVWLYDVSDPLVTDRVITEFTTPGGARAVSIFNGIGYVADSGAGLQAVNYLAYDQQREPPSIALATNFADQLAEAGAVMRVSAAVTDDVQVRNVEFYVDGVRIATDGDFPFEHRFVVPPLSAGGFLLRARASDTGGNATLSEEITFTIVPDAIRPVVRRLSPPSGGFTSTIAAVAVFFSEPVDPTSLAGFTVSVRSGDTLIPVPGQTLEYQAEINTAFLRFPAPLPVGRYVATLPATVKDLAGNTLAQASTWSFGIAALGSDRDQDCVPDSLETLLGLNPDDTDSDDDLILDGDEDNDGDGLNNCGEAVLGRDPTATDSDGDGVSDSQEDTDSDGIRDGEEVSRGTDGFVTDPLDVNTDGDAMDDAVEVAFGTNPTVPDAAANVVVDGRTVTISGGARLDALTLRNGAMLTHPPATPDAIYRLDLQITGALSIDATSAIDVSARGFVGGGRLNAGELSGRTLGNVLGSTNRNGGSYGGLGGAGSNGGSATAVYGDPREPNEPGSGGGSDGGGNTAGAGGGVVRLTAGSLQLEGSIRATGGSQVGGQGTAGGSGGAVKITVGTLGGTGTIEANGGSGDGNTSGGGGGGRVAVFFDETEDIDAGSISVNGGNGLNAGAAGTAVFEAQ